MKRILPITVFAVSLFSLANCTKPQPVVERHYYHTNTRHVKPSASVSSHSKSAGLTGSSPETFEAVTPPSSYSR